MRWVSTSNSFVYSDVTFQNGLVDRLAFPVAPQRGRCVWFCVNTKQQLPSQKHSSSRLSVSKLRKQLHFQKLLHPPLNRIKRVDVTFWIVVYVLTFKKKKKKKTLHVTHFREVTFLLPVWRFDDAFLAVQKALCCSFVNNYANLFQLGTCPPLPWCTCCVESRKLVTLLMTLCWVNNNPRSNNFANINTPDINLHLCFCCGLFLPLCVCCVSQSCSVKTFQQKEPGRVNRS